MMGTATATDNVETALSRYVRERDPDAFEQLVLRYQALVYAACRRHLDVAADVEDAVQETFLKLARHAETIRSNLSAWLFVTALNTAVKMQSRAESRSRHERDRAELAVPTHDNDSDGPTWDELGPEIDRAMSSLSVADRQLLTERYLLGRSATELAEEANVSRVTLHKRLKRAVEQLRKTLTQRGVVVSASALMVTLSSVPAEAAPPAALTASLIKIGLAGCGGGAATVSTAGVAATGGSVFGTKTLLAAGITALLTGGSVVALLAADNNKPNTPPATASPTQTEKHAAGSQLPDPALAGNWLTYEETDDWRHNVITFSGTDIFATSLTRDGRIVVQNRWGTLAAGDPTADPPTLDLVGNVINDQAKFYVLAIYRLIGDELHLALAGGEDPAQVQRPRASKNENGVEYELFLKRDQPLKLPNGGRTEPCAFAPRLTGDWVDVEPYVMSFGPKGKTLRWLEIGTDNVHSELKILSWQTDTKPRRIEGVYLQHHEKRLIGRTMKMIYRVTEDRLELAHYNLNKEASTRWPRSFSPAEDLVTKVWERSHATTN